MHVFCIAGWFRAATPFLGDITVYLVFDVLIDLSLDCIEIYFIYDTLMPRNYISNDPIANIHQFFRICYFHFFDSYICVIYCPQVFMLNLANSFDLVSMRITLMPYR